MSGWSNLCVLVSIGALCVGCGSSQTQAEEPAQQPAVAEPAPPPQPPPPAVIETHGFSLTVPNGLTRIDGPDDSIVLLPAGETSIPADRNDVIQITVEMLDEEVQPSAMGCATLLVSRNESLSFNPENSPTGFDVSGVLACEAEGTVTLEGGQLIAGYLAMLMQNDRIALVLATARLGEQAGHFEAARQMVRTMTYAGTAAPHPEPDPAPAPAPAAEPAAGTTAEPAP